MYFLFFLDQYQVIEVHDNFASGASVKLNKTGGGKVTSGNKQGATTQIEVTANVHQNSGHSCRLPQPIPGEKWNVRPKQPSPAPEPVDQNVHLESEESNLQLDALEEELRGNNQRAQGGGKGISANKPGANTNARQNSDSTRGRGRRGRSRGPSQPIPEEKCDDYPKQPAAVQIVHLENEGSNLQQDFPLKQQIGNNPSVQGRAKGNSSYKAAAKTQARGTTNVRQNSGRSRDKEPRSRGVRGSQPTPGLEERHLVNIPSVKELRTLDLSEPPIKRGLFTGKVHPDAEKLFREASKPALYSRKVDGKKEFFPRSEFIQKFPGKRPTYTKEAENRKSLRYRIKRRISIRHRKVEGHRKALCKWKTQGKKIRSQKPDGSVTPTVEDLKKLFFRRYIYMGEDGLPVRNEEGV